MPCERYLARSNSRSLKNKRQVSDALNREQFEPHCEPLNKSIAHRNTLVVLDALDLLTGHNGSFIPLLAHRETALDLKPFTGRNGLISLFVTRLMKH